MRYDWPLTIVETENISYSVKETTGVSSLESRSDILETKIRG